MTSPLIQNLNEMSIPKGFRENLAWRRDMLSRAKKDPVYMAKVRELFFRDVVFAFNAFLYTYDPRKRPFHHQPFCTYDYEDELVMELVAGVGVGEDRLVEKSRDMGVTWTVLGVFLWFWLHPVGGNDFLVGSRIEDYVDKKGDPRTHFSKLRYMIYKLPKWLRPKGFNPRRDDNYMKLVNPETGSAITGESNNANFSTQGRYRAVLFDEFAKWESTDESAWTAAGDATPCRIPVSTPFGAGGRYYMLATGEKIRRLSYHWTRHPEKSLGMNCVWPVPNEEDKERLGEDWEPDEVIRSPWYDRECLRRSPAEIAQELDIDYLGSGNPIFDGKAWKSLNFYHKRALEPRRVCQVDIEKLILNNVPMTYDPEGFFQIFEEFDSGHSYVIAADVVEGVEGGDFAVVKVYDREMKSVVGSYFSRVDEVTLARVIYTVVRFYSLGDDDYYAPWVAVETNGPGLATFDKLVDLGVGNLFMAPRYDVVKGGVSYKKGWRTDTNSRNELVAGVRSWLVDRAGEIDKRCVGELMTFVRSRTGKPVAKSGCHDDEVICFGIAIQVDEIAPYEKRRVEEKRRADGLVDRVFELKEVKELSVEEACFAQAQMNRDVLKMEANFWEDW